MFLVVFVTLAISIIALFGQVLTLQTSRINAAQVGLMQIMATWHGAAVSSVQSTVPTNLTPATPCTLIANPLFPTCTPSNLISNLPAGYQSGFYSFYSVAFQTAAPTVNYVITYVVPAATPTSNLILASGREVGYSMNSLSRQFARAAPASLSYGTVTAAGTLTLMTHADSAGTAPPVTAYSIPATIPVGSIAAISAAQ